MSGTVYQCLHYLKVSLHIEEHVPAPERDLSPRGEQEVLLGAPDVRRGHAFAVMHYSQQIDSVRK